MSTSKIEWTETTWNPVTGCTKISPGCKNCYAERMAHRLKAMGSPGYKNGFEVTCHPNRIGAPLRWKKNRMVFVNSMSDIFHKNVPLQFIKEIFYTMSIAPQHQFQVLTKRSDRLSDLSGKLYWYKNIWMGVSIESEDFLERVNDLRKTDAAIKFVSMEPLLGPINHIDLTNIDWVIVGGESGPKARPIKEKWVEDLKVTCVNNNVPFFFKQWGGTNKKKTGRLLKGRIWDQMPLI